MPAGRAAAETIDRIAVIVGKHVIKSSDIDHDIRLTAFLNKQSFDFSPQAERASADRLVDQELIRQELVTGSYRRPPETEGDTLQSQLVRDRFSGSETQFRQALKRYGLSPDQLRAELLWQVTVLRFIDQRFRAGVFVSDDEAHQYCEEHQAALRKQSPDANEDSIQAKCRETLEGEQVNRNFDEWLQQQHKNTRIEYKEEAFT
jgi:peptidyl-prolyl cis-trans isomerase SurA